MKKIFYLVFIGFFLIQSQSCESDDEILMEEPEVSIEPENPNEEEEPEEEEEAIIQWELPEVAYDYTPHIPDYVISNLFGDLEQIYLDGFSAQPFEVSNQTAALGRVLFYDPRLSIDNTTSCGSCHQQENGFSSSEQFSEGVYGQLTSRNSMSLVNLRWNINFFWDIRENNLEEQTLQPIIHPEEMGSNLEDLVAELDTIDGYPALFENAFGSSEISSTKISEALTHFVRSLVSLESKYDRGTYNDFQDFTEAELAGKTLFFNGNGLTKCNQCHSTQTFLNSNDPRNNGLGHDPNDQGRYEITGNEADKGKFKTVTLRNIGVTAPYMHDGRFETLEEVIEFYNSDIQQHPNLNDRLTEDFEIGGTPVKMNLTDEDIANLAAFLRTFTDQDFITNEKFSNPFIE